MLKTAQALKREYYTKDDELTIPQRHAELCRSEGLWNAVLAVGVLLAIGVTIAMLRACV